MWTSIRLLLKRLIQMGNVSKQSISIETVCYRDYWIKVTKSEGGLEKAGKLFVPEKLLRFSE
jgi:hypothetical protein